MIWDGLIILLAITLAIAGWNVGIINSWRGPIAIIIATLATQQLYVDFSTWVVQQLRVQPDMAVAIGYVLLWGAFEITLEILLSVLVPLGSKKRPMMFERIAGAFMGLVKAAIVVLLPVMCLQVVDQNGIPKPPPQKNQMTNLIDSGADKSTFIKIFGGIAHGMLPTLGPVVVSKKTPSFQPNFSGKSDDEKL
jgi:hypothetical protein